MRPVLLLAGVCVALAAGGCKKPKSAATSSPVTTPTAPKADDRNTSYVPGAGLQNVRRAADRVKLQSQLSQLGIMIQAMYEEGGRKMPDFDAVKQELRKQGAGEFVRDIEEGIVKCVWTDQFDGLWAYEVGAEVQGGLGLASPGVARRYDAEELKALLNRR